MSISSILTVNSIAYNQSARKSKSLLVDGFGWDVDADHWLEFHEVIAGPQPFFKSPFNCSLSVNTGSGAQLVFSGQIVGYQPYFGAEGRSWSYRAMGLKYLANWLPVTAIDGSGTIRFNVSPIDYTYYTPALAGQTVGQIIQYCLTQHATALAGVGITADGTTASQLAALTLVPNVEVDISGERLWLAMEAVLQQWARNIRLIILPTGLVRVIDVTAGTALNLVLGLDPVDPPLLSANWQHCATAMTVRGQGLIEPAYVSTTPVGGVQTLTPAWTTAQANAWAYADFLNPPGSTDNGTCSVTSPTTISCQSTNHSLSLATNAWDLVNAQVYLTNSAGTGLTFTESRQITANTAAVGGAYTITLNYPLTNVGYNNYKITGTGGTLANGALVNVWRDYSVTDPGRLIANHLVRQFPAQVGFSPANSNSAILTNFPIAIVSFAFGGGSPPFVVDPVRGHIVFVRPVVEGGNPISVLNTGGSAVIAPTDITCLLAYSRGALATTFPTTGFSGTAYTAANLQRTGFCDVPTWTYFGNSPVLSQLAQMLQQSVGNTIMEGTVHFKGFYLAALNPTAGATPGYVLSFSAVDYTTGQEALKIPLRAYSVTYQVRGGGLNYTTDMRVSTRQDPRTGETYYAHLSTLGSGVFQPRFEGSFQPESFGQPSIGDPHGLGEGLLTQFEDMDTTGFAQNLNLKDRSGRPAAAINRAHSLAAKGDQNQRDRESAVGPLPPPKAPEAEMDVSIVPLERESTAPQPIEGGAELDIAARDEAAEKQRRLNRNPEPDAEF